VFGSFSSSATSAASIAASARLENAYNYDKVNYSQTKLTNVYHKVLKITTELLLQMSALIYE